MPSSHATHTLTPPLLPRYSHVRYLARHQERPANSDTSRYAKFMVDNDSFGKVNEPGLILADCLRVEGVLPYNTRGGLDGGGAEGGDDAHSDRFNAFGPKRLVDGKTDDWYRRYHPKGGAAGELHKGLECCSSR